MRRRQAPGTPRSLACCIRAGFDGARLIGRGKRSKERTAYVEGGARDALADWIVVRGRVPGPLFCAINKAGKLQPGRVSTQAVYNMLLKRGAEAGVENFSPHDFRRTSAQLGHLAGVPITQISTLLGHADVRTTQRYLNLELDLETTASDFIPLSGDQCMNATARIPGEVLLPPIEVTSLISLAGRAAFGSDSVEYRYFVAFMNRADYAVVPARGSMMTQIIVRVDFGARGNLAPTTWILTERYQEELNKQLEALRPPIFLFFAPREETKSKA